MPKKLEEADALTESDFEAEVYRQLVGEGYRVKTQWPVGAYRIDLVVEGDEGKRLAVECDGDRWHYNRVAEDLARQALLERLGWRFARIGGTAYYRDRKEAMRPVFERLHAMGIAPANPMVTPAPNQQMGLLESVKRRAAEIRREWQQAASSK